MDRDKTQKTKVFYGFGEFRLDAENRRLWRNDELVALTPKEFDVLFYLISNAGKVVEKRELLDVIWADTFVEETTLARNVSWLRKKLGDAGEGEKIIQTVPKRGYSFAAQIIRYEDETALTIDDTNTIIVEEQTIQHFLVEEKITIKNERDALEIHEIPQTLLELKPQTQTRKSKWFLIGLGALLVSLIGTILYLSLFRQPKQNVVMVSKVAPFSGLAGREDMPAFSPDGKMLAFVWNGGDGENLDVYIKFIGEGEPVRLTKNDANDIRPVFSPDGKQIAFIRVHPTHSELLSVPPLGGGERHVCDLRRNSSSISFSPDGRFIAVHDGEDNNKRAGIFLVNIDNGEKRRITEPPDLTADDRPTFSPDGGQIAFMRSYGQQVQELFIVSAEGGDARQITFDKAWIGGAAWSADGEKIIFASLRKYNSQTNIWQIEVSKNNAQPQLISTGGKRLANPAVSPDKRTIAFVEETYNTNIWRLEMKETEHLSERKFAPSSFNDNSPNISPNGKRVVFASNRTGKYDLWIADTDGSNVRQLTDIKNASAGSPRFSPDSKQIVFDLQLNGNGDIYIVSSDGGSPRRLTDSPSTDFMPSWSADGKSIYFASNRSKTAQIYKMSVDGGDAKQITQDGGRESYASPDGKYLYYSKSEGTKGLWRISTEGGDEQPANELSEVGAWRYWSMTKAGLYYVQRSDYPPYKIMFYDFTTKQTTEKTMTDASPIWVYPGLSVLDDGKVIFYTKSGQNSSNIMLAQFE